MSDDDLGDRMKMYEGRETSRKAMPGLPIYVRLDGRGFSRFTKGLVRPYDERMCRCMIETTRYLVAESHARIGFVQSDEISLCYLAEERDSTLLFDGKFQKLTSILASMATAKFNQMVGQLIPEKADMLPCFDARVIDMPSKVEVANMFLWRQLDASKNSVSMAAHHYFGHAELQGMNGPTKQEKLWQEKGVNWNDYPPMFRRGVFLKKITESRKLTEEELARIPVDRRPMGPVLRSSVVEIDMDLRKMSNRVEAIFDGADPAYFVD
jgi:tRNA(His) guanylyltransferase